MKYPTWNEFLGKYPENPQGAFEALCRLLFRAKFGIDDSLPYFYNNAGNETVPVNVGKDVIGFQSKFFSGDTIDDSQANQIKHSIKTAHTTYPQQTKIIVYTNSTFGNPKAGAQKTTRQKDIEDTAKDNTLIIEWMFGNDILDIVSKTPLAYSLFFEPNSNLNHLPTSVVRMNKLNFENISSTIKYRNREIKIDRTKEVADIKECISKGKNVLVFGESGSGKSAIIKHYWQEGISNNNINLYFTRGEQFDTKSINDLFLMDEAYSFVGFRDFYKGFTYKILIVDSAEKLTEISNLTVLQLILEGLGEKGWQFIFTCKDNAYNALRSLLKDLGIDAVDLKVDAVQEEALRELGEQHNIALPQNEKVLHQLRIPFYLARYCELGGVDVATMEAFKEAVWTQKVRGSIRSGFQQRRENCLLQIVSEQQAQNAFFVTPTNLDYDAAYSLIQEDVLMEQPHKGYAVKHDLYVDWTLEYIVEKDCATDTACIQLLQSDPVSITYLNAFSRWLTSIIDTKDSRVTAITDFLVDGTIKQRWEHCLLSVIGSSNAFAVTFFEKHNAALKANKYALFDRFVDILEVSCKKVSQYFEYKGERIPIYYPEGRGWEEAVLFVDANKDDYYMNHLGTVQKLLNGYSRMGNKAVAMNQAAQLSLRIFDIMAESRKKQQSFWFEKEKTWCELVCTYAFGIRKELRVRFSQVVDNRWVHHTDPYSELVDYILKDPNNFSKSMLYLSCLDSVISLMQLFWKEQPINSQDKHGHHHSFLEREDVFGLNEDFGIDMSYFPSSPFQTPIGIMLESEQLISPKKTQVLDFIISFMNDCVKYFDQRDKLDEHMVISVQLPNGTSHEIIASQSLWNLYRGTASYSMPHLLESIHMALERWLLQITDEKQKTDWEFIKQLLWQILIKSHSASLYAIVASVTVAHPDELFEILMFLCYDIRFLALDSNRCSAEISASTLSIAFQHYQSWWEERDRSNNLPHRQQHLETMLMNCQCTYSNSTDDDLAKRLDIAYQVVDILKEQVERIGNENSIYRFILARVDYRSCKKQNVILKNGVEAVLLTPNFTPEMEEERKAIVEFSNKLGAMNLRVWAEKRFKSEEKDLKGNSYVGKPKEVLETIRTIENQISNQTSDQLLMPGDIYIPYMASAVLLMYEREHLSDKEKSECLERVILALNSLEAMASDSMSELEICIAAIPVLIDVFPEKQSDFVPIIAEYVRVTNEFINQRICDMMSNSIHQGQLWNRHPEIMNSILDQIQAELLEGDWETMNSEIANAILCLLTFEPPEDKRYLGKICIEKLSSNWQVTSRYHFYKNKYHIAENIAKYILFAPREDVGALIRPYAMLLDWDSPSEPLITNFVINAPQYHKYDNFWIVWKALYKPITEETKKHYRDTILNEYLLNPLFFMKDSDDWFILEEKDLAFFERVANDIGDHPTVMYAFSRVFATIGKRYSKQSIVLFGDIINKHNPKLQETEKQTVFYLEKISKKVLAENEQDFRSDRQLKNKLIIVLEFMRSYGSSVADGMIKNM